jgi:hypothetical protein
LEPDDQLEACYQVKSKITPERLLSVRSYRFSDKFLDRVAKENSPESEHGQHQYEPDKYLREEESTGYVWPLLDDVRPEDALILEKNTQSAWFCYIFLATMLDKSFKTSSGTT